MNKPLSKIAITLAVMALIIPLATIATAQAQTNYIVRFYNAPYGGIIQWAYGSYLTFPQPTQYGANAYYIEHGSIITINAKPTIAGYVFDHFSYVAGPISGNSTENPMTVQVFGGFSINPVFKPVQALTTWSFANSPQDGAAGTLSYSVNGVSHGAQADVQLTQGATVYLSANPNSGYVFSHYDIITANADLNGTYTTANMGFTAPSEGGVVTAYFSMNPPLEDDTATLVFYIDSGAWGDANFDYVAPAGKTGTGWYHWFQEYTFNVGGRLTLHAVESPNTVFSYWSINGQRGSSLKDYDYYLPNGTTTIEPIFIKLPSGYYFEFGDNSTSTPPPNNSTSSDAQRNLVNTANQLIPITVILFISAVVTIGGLFVVRKIQNIGKLGL